MRFELVVTYIEHFVVLYVVPVELLSETDKYNFIAEKSGIR